MNAERLLNTFLELVRIDSPSLHEADVAAYCKQVLEQAGCTVTFDDSAEQTESNTGNLIASLPGTAPGKLYFSAHMDTVSPGEDIEPQVKDGVITSAGETVLGGDDKVGVAAILELIRILSENEKPHPEIGVLLSIGEEIGLRGAKAIDGSAFRGEPCFVLDAAGKPGEIVIGAPFHDSFTATFTGKAAHAGVEPENGVSAISLASKAVLALPLGRLDERTTMNVGTISGGTANNIVPDTCVVTGEFRAFDEDRLKEVHAQIASVFDAAVAGSEGSVSVEWLTEYPGFKIEEDAPLVQSILDAARSLGLTAKTDLTGGGSDANVLAGKGLTPLVLCTGMAGIHSLDERLEVKDLEDLTRLCIAIAYIT
jgi:tripeptide aminopeptidase